MTYPQPYGYPVLPVPTQVVLAPHRCSTAHVVVAWVLAAATGLYLLPWAVAATRNRSNVVAVAIVNLLLGWSVVGWVVALVMACGSDRPVFLVQHTYAPAAPWSPPASIAPAPRPWALRPTAPELTRVDPLGSEPTVWLPQGPGYGDRR